MFEKKTIIFDAKEAILVTELGRYSLKDTMECGQCFRYEKIDRQDGCDEYMTVVGGRLIRVAQRTAGELIFPEMDDEVFESVARKYFSIDRDLRAIKEDIIGHTDSEWLCEAAEFAEGVAILTQEPWEMLVSFIISQNNNIPRIRKIVREICAEYGENLLLKSTNISNNDNLTCPLKRTNDTPNDSVCKLCGRCFSFPSALDIAEHPEGLLPSKPGFRYSYILDAAEKVVSKEVRLDMIANAGSYAHTLECLKTIKGVGDKVASCVALFGFSNLEAFPIDVWMKRAIDTYFDGKLDHEALGRYAGIAQQYIFHYIRHIEMHKN